MSMPTDIATVTMRVSAANVADNDVITVSIAADNIGISFFGIVKSDDEPILNHFRLTYIRSSSECLAL